MPKTKESNNENTIKGKIVKERNRIWNLVIYPDEDPTHAEALRRIREQFAYLGIVHNKDTWTKEDEAKNPDHKEGTLKKTHMHILLKFPQARWNTALADTLGIGVNYMEPCRDMSNTVEYFLHEGLEGKAQYDASSLEGPLVPAAMKILNKKVEDERVLDVLELIDNMGIIEDWADMIAIACAHGLYGDLRRMGYMLGKVVESHNARVKKLLAEQGG